MEAVDEVGNPTILATFAVIAAILPMAFVGGLMGPYMRPIPIGASRGDGLLAAGRVHRDAVGRSAAASAQDSACDLSSKKVGRPVSIAA